MDRVQKFFFVLAAIFFVVTIALALSTRAKGDQPTNKEAPKPALPLKLEDQAGDLTGIYECHGKEIGGKSYAGSVNIMKRGDVYLVSWNVAANHFAGVGIRLNDQLSVAWCAQTPNGLARGVNVYTIKGKALNGYWSTLPGNRAKNPETLTFLKDLEVNDDQ